MTSALSLQPWQWGVLAVAYVLFFALPAVWMWRRATRDGDNAFAWTLLVLVGSVLGVVEYYEHRSILKRRARRGPPEEPDAQQRVETERKR